MHLSLSLSPPAQIRPPANVRQLGLGPGHVLRGHRVGPQHRLLGASLRPGRKGEELHDLLRHLQRPHGRRSHHRDPDQLQVRFPDSGTGERSTIREALYRVIANRPSNFTQEVEKPPAEPTREEQLQSQLSQQLNLPSLQDSSAAVNPKPQPPEDKVYLLDDP